VEKSLLNRDAESHSVEGQARAVSTDPGIESCRLRAQSHQDADNPVSRQHRSSAVSRAPKHTIACVVPSAQNAHSRPAGQSVSAPSSPRSGCHTSG
jgi:hypothetical protein